MKARLKRFGYFNTLIILIFIFFLAQSFIERDKNPEVDAYIKSLLSHKEVETNTITKSLYKATYQYDRNEYITVTIKPYEVTTQSLKDTAISKIKSSADQQNINLPNGFEHNIEIRLIEYTVTNNQ